MNRTGRPVAAETDTVDAEVHSARRRATFTDVILRHEGDLLRCARRLCGGDEARAQDLAQDTLVRAYRAWLGGHLREDGNAHAWLLRIVTNLYINDYRRRRRWEAGIGIDSRPVEKRIAEMSQRAGLVESPAARLMMTSLDEAVERALATLPEKLRQCLILVGMEGLDYAQAARALGVPIGTVRSRLSRSRELLKPLLRDYASVRHQITA